MKIKKIILENFKGTKSAEYTVDGKSAVISGSNGKGKTTIADAFYYLMADCDYSLIKKPEIFPLDVEESMPKVTVITDFDGKECTLSKWQKRSIKEKNGITEVSTKNEFSINEVPKSATTFKEYLADCNISEKTFLLFSHPEVFTGFMDNKKDRDYMRSFLFDMAETYSDLEIAQMSDETSNVAELLGKYSIGELDAMYKSQKKKAVENVESIPDQIIGLEMSKVNEDLSELNQEKQSISKQIEELKSSKNADNTKDIKDLKTKKNSLLAKVENIKQELINKQKAEKTKIEHKQLDIVRELAKAYNDKAIIDGQIGVNEKNINRLNEERNKAGAEYKEYEKKVFDESKWTYNEDDEFCSLCGQKLPQDKIDSLKEEVEQKKAKEKADFEKLKKDKMNSLVKVGKETLAEMKELEKEVNKLKKESETLSEKIEELKVSKTDIEETLQKAHKGIDFDNNIEIIALYDEVAKIDTQIAIHTSENVDTDAIDTQLAELEQNLSEIDKRIGVFEHNKDIDSQIEELREQQKTAEQEKANAEKILYQLDLVSRKKNTMLSDEINKHFSLVNFLFFDYQKNGEYKEVCVPMVNGKRLGQSMNTGLEIMAKLDIISGLQKFYGVEIPVFLDQAEKLDTTSMKDVCDRYSDLQIISLKVSDDDLKVEVV